MEVMCNIYVIVPWVKSLFEADKALKTAISGMSWQGCRIVFNHFKTF